MSNFTSDSDFIGKTMGAYRITEQLGSGTMGTVFKAVHASGEFTHEVAVKLIKRGVESEESIRRFKMEREIRANLHHQNIARLYDSGITEYGIPYLVREYVDGVPIDRYCDEQQMTINERLDLFTNICAAVQFAHTNLVVHRNLKAQNIFVKSDGTVKILDFGIAKLFNKNLPAIEFLETQSVRMSGTLEYAAPELFKNEPVTTSADIYALGILLHKLLTDTFPLDLEGKSLREAEHTVHHISPRPASQCLSNHSSPDQTARRRKTTAYELLSILEGDLNALILKAIRKEPEFRYASVSQLADDIGRYRTGISLIARNNTLQYRFAKFTQRHKAGLAVTAAILVCAFLLTGFYTWRLSQEWMQAKSRAQKYEQVAEFLIGLFSVTNSTEVPVDTLTGTELLERGVARAGELKDQPAVYAGMLYAIGRTYKSMGQPKEARPLLEQALHIQQTYWKGDHADIAATMNTLGALLITSGELETSEILLREALAMRRRLLGEHHPDVFSSMNNLAGLVREKGAWDEAEKLYKELLNAQYDWYGNEHPKIGASLNNLAQISEARGNLTKAETYYREALAMWRKLEGDRHSDVSQAQALNNLAALLQKRANLDEAETLFKQALAIRRKVYGDEHVMVGTCLNNLALVQKDKRDFRSAELAARKAIKIFHKAYGDSDDHLNIATSLYVHAEIYKAKGNLQKAEKYHRKALTIRRKLLGDDHMVVANSLTQLGILYIDQQQAEKAEPMIRRALTIYQDFLPGGDWRIIRLKGTLGTCLLAQARYRDAESLFIEGYQKLKTVNGIEERYLQEALNHLITLYDKWNKPDKAASFRNEVAIVLRIRDEG